MKTMIPYLFFNGQCEEAMNFYAKGLGGSIGAISRFKDAPGMPPEMGDMVMNMNLHADGMELMGSDNPQMKEGGERISLCANFETNEQLDSAFKGLSEGAGNLHGPQVEFWGDYYASFTDKYGINWMLITPKKG